MISFLKSFLSNEKSPEEQAILAAQQRPRDVMVIDAYAMDDEEEQPKGGGCSGGGCGGCACG